MRSSIACETLNRTKLVADCETLNALPGARTTFFGQRRSGDLGGIEVVRQAAPQEQARLGLEPGLDAEGLQPGCRPRAWRATGGVRSPSMCLR